MERDKIGIPVERRSSSTGSRCKNKEEIFQRLNLLYSQDKESRNERDNVNSRILDLSFFI